MDSRPHLLIDADILAFKAAVVVQETEVWPDGLDSSGFPRSIATVTAPVGKAVAILNRMVQGLIDGLEAGSLTMALTSSSSFRKDLVPSYKENRKEKSAPIALGAVRQYILDNYPSMVVDGLEADDVLGIMATTPRATQRPPSLQEPSPEREPRAADQIICTIDKDLLTIPGRHFNWDKPERGVVTVSRSEALAFFFQQCLTGDATDGYEGLERVGPKTAQKLLAAHADVYAVRDLEAEAAEPGEDHLFQPYIWDEGDWAEAVLQPWLDKGRTEVEALTCSRLARILRWADFNFETMTPRLYRAGLPLVTAEQEGGTDGE